MKASYKPLNCHGFASTRLILEMCSSQLQEAEAYCTARLVMLVLRFAILMSEYLLGAYKLL